MFELSVYICSIGAQQCCAPTTVSAIPTYVHQTEDALTGEKKGLHWMTGASWGCFFLFGEVVFEKRAVVHYEADVFEFIDHFQRVAGDGDHVGVGAGGQDAD